jgi:NADH:ubiquinone oxidoreductase subunit 5 (subunit L)/multisubunit Na+/H+ antiporter MnhA subunit
MEGPTPVSSLLHAATMVTAGIFLLIRCAIFFEYAGSLLVFITLIGGLTSFFFAMVSIFQYDIKKIIAYSTCSQLGYMFFSSGLSNYQIAIFHLFNHAFFKALLFLGAGSIIHAIIDEQDIRKMGKFLNYLPFTYICIFIGSLAIIGFPFLTGFYSKDIILELAFTRYSIDGMYIYILSIMAAFFTSVYSTRLLLFIFYGKINNYFISFSRLHECSIKMLISIFILAVFSISIGSISKDYFIGMGTPF